MSRTNHASYRLPWPPSLNRLWRSTPGGVKLSEAGRQYAVAVSNALPVGVVRKFRKRLVVWVFLHAPNARPIDIDNRCKALLDSCTKACLWQDDGLIDELHVMRGVPDPAGAGYVEMIVQELDSYPEIA
ncbi:MAG: RusA family crossover junction endodeoxyribonuclease [Paraburkholderia sp.]|uniref:RusA family crossover junction endodeoxyribonuclease n=1 Tax=Paraburkholderia sp. TaxID=1926495 RepID=UPI0011FC7831|nr:RusA family crossover junction endodeoxyribonuclease [Paraburkholderia sp.]TAL99560.1 MAG: RusA family crossover junction endodeoxyribonuclease [Paraburkholderia sp.]